MRFSSLLFSLPLASIAAAAIMAAERRSCAPTPKRIVELFEPYTSGNASKFYEDVVSPQVNWTVTGTGRMAGIYTSLAKFLNATKPIGEMLAGPLYLEVIGVTTGQGVMADGEDSSQWAVVELKTKNGTKCKNGLIYNNQYAWVTKWEDEKIVEVRAYLDSLLLETALDQNHV